MSETQFHRGPRHLVFCSYEKRLKTFSHWPPSLKQKKESMATAGFYYGGFADYVNLNLKIFSHVIQLFIGTMFLL